MLAKPGVDVLPRDTIMSYHALADGSVGPLNDLAKERALVVHGGALGGGASSGKKKKPEVTLRIEEPSASKRRAATSSPSLEIFPPPPKKQKRERSPSWLSSTPFDPERGRSGERCTFKKPLYDADHMEKVFVPFLKDALVKGPHEKSEVSVSAALLAHVLACGGNLAGTERRMEKERAEMDEKILGWKQRYGDLERKEVKAKSELAKLKVDFQQGAQTNADLDKLMILSNFGL